MNVTRLLLVLLLVAAPASAQDHTDVVAAVKANLVAQGINLSGPCGAFQITGRVAFLLRAEGWGLIAKSSGQNGCTVANHGRYAVDAVMQPDGTAVDMLINSETENIPAWQPTGAAPPASWRAPFALDPEIPPTPQNFRIISRSPDHDATLGLMAAAKLDAAADRDSSVTVAPKTSATDLRETANFLGKVGGAARI